MLPLLALLVTASIAAASPSFAAKTSLHLNPNAATPGATVSITGKGFGAFKSVQSNRVTFNGVPALIQRWEADVIEVKVPFQALDGPVQVVSGKKKVNAGTFTVLRPAIEQVTPAEAEPGTTVQITGHHFGNTAGPRDPNTMFGVNDVMIGGVKVRPRRWKEDKIEVDIPANATSGDVLVRLASSDPLPDGSCCAPVQYTVSNAVSLKLIPSIRVDPLSGPVGTKVVLFGKGFGTKTAEDAVLIGGHPTTIAKWADDMIVLHVPLDAETGPMVLKSQARERALGTFTVHVPKASAISPATAPIGTLLKISGEHFGYYSESGSTPYNFMDFDIGQNKVEIGGVQAVVYRWSDDRIDVWVPFSAKSGKVVVYRGATKPNADGSCCAERALTSTEAGDFTLVTPVIESYSPTSAGLDERVTIKGKGFGTFLTTAEHAHLGINQKAYKRSDEVELNENVSRTEVLFNGIAAQVDSWTDTQIVARVPRVHIVGAGKKGEFNPDLTVGPLVVRRGSWDLLPDGTCCTPKRWLTLEAGRFTIEPKGLPDPSYFNSNRPDASTNQ